MDDSQGAHLGDSLTFIPFNPVDPKGTNSRILSSQSEKPKKRLVSEEEKANSKAVKAKGACWRCKILKKQCDDEETCKQCPERRLESARDYWKILGCHRGGLASLVDRCIPVDFKYVVREVTLQSGRTVNLKLLATQTAENDWASSNTETSLGSPSTGCLLHKYYAPYHSDNPLSRNKSISGLHESDLVTASELVRLGDIENLYWTQTAYNPITLLSNIRALGQQNFDVNHDEISSLSQKIIIGACGFFQREAQAAFAVDVIVANEDDWAGEDVIVDVDTYSASHLKRDLKACLKIFEKTCSKLNSIRPAQWPSIFYLLIAISIVKSIMVNVRTIQRQRHSFVEDPNGINIESTYRALVSIFAWASGPFDPLLDEHARNNLDGIDSIPGYAETLRKVRKLIKTKRWGTRNIRSSKDYLMGLGKGVFLDGKFDGFIFQIHDSRVYFTMTLAPSKGVELPVESKSEGNTSHETGTQGLTDTTYSSTHQADFTKALDAEEENVMIYSQETLSSNYASGAIIPGLNRFESAQNDNSEANKILDIVSTEALGKYPSPHENTASILQSTMASPDNNNSHTLLGVTNDDIQMLRRHHMTARASAIGQKMQRYPRAIEIANNNEVEGSYECRGAGLKSALSSLKSSLRSYGSPMSISSWIKEDILISGMSPSSWRSLSISNQSGTSLQKLGEKFLQDFTCCGRQFRTLHELVEHRETCPEQKSLSAPACVSEEEYKDQDQPLKEASSLSAGFESQMERAQPRAPSRYLYAEDFYTNPGTLKPYSNTIGTATKMYPYECDVCRSRYKTLNSLKHHKYQSPQCDSYAKRAVESVQGDLANVMLTDDAITSL